MSDAIRAEALRTSESLLWTFKQHFNAEVWWTRWHFALGIPATALTAAIGSAVSADLPTAFLVAASAGAGILVATATFLRPDRRAAKHRDVAHRQRALHDRIRTWVNIELPVMEGDEALVALRSFACERDALEGDAPPLSNRTYRRVRQGIEAGEAEFLVDSS